MRIYTYRLKYEDDDIEVDYELTAKQPLTVKEQKAIALDQIAKMGVMVHRGKICYIKNGGATAEGA